MAIKPIIKKVPFSKLSKANKRIELAKDVITQVKAKKYIATQMTYFDGYEIAEEARILGSKDTDQLNKVLPKITCECCAKGALLMAGITKINHCSLFDIEQNSGNDDYILDKLKDIFISSQLHLIETAFEGRIINDSDSYNDDEKAKNLYLKYKHSDTRLIGIMNNIIKNSGTFKP